MPFVKKSPVTPNQAAANRSNASRSTGPVTPEGKRFSRLNALRTGYYAEYERLVGEALLRAGSDPADFDHLRESLRQTWAPRGSMEDRMVRDLAQLLWHRQVIQTFLGQRILQRAKRQEFERQKRHEPKFHQSNSEAAAGRANHYWTEEPYDWNESRLQNRELEELIASKVKILLRMKQGLPLRGGKEGALQKDIHSSSWGFLQDTANNSKYFKNESERT